MPDKVRESLAVSYKAYLDFAEKGIKAPTPQDLRYMSMLNSLYGDKGGVSKRSPNCILPITIGIKQNN